MATANPSGTRTYPTERGYRADGATAASTTTRTEKGISLARGPALILGTLLTAVGLYLLYKARTFPPFSNFPNGTAAKDGNFLFGIFGANGWTAMLTAVGGGLLLFGAAQHLLAKTMSLVVGVALGAATVIALISGNVLGMAATNGWTKLGWAICAAILLFNTLVPRRRRTVTVADEPVASDGPATYERDAAPAAYERGPATAAGEGEPTVAHDTAGEGRTVAHDPAGEERTVAHDPAGEERTVAHDPAGEERTVAHNPAGEERTVAHPAGEEPTVAHPAGEGPTAVRRAETVD